MAQLKDSVVSGNLRVTDTTLTDTLQVTTVKAPSTSGGTTYTAGTSGQVLKSNGTTTYWGDDYSSDTKVNVTLATTTKAYLLGTSITPTGTAQAVTSVADTGVYLDTTAGKLTTGSLQSNGNVTLYSASGDSPALIFKRGTFTDNSLDWRIQDFGGKLYFDRDKNEASETWENILNLDPTNNKMYFKNTEVSLDGHTHDDRYVPKTTYEWNKEISFGSSGYLKIGSFPMYDTNITINIDATTSRTYHGTVVIATQNVSTTSMGSNHKIHVYDDPTGNIAASLRIVWTSGSRNYDIYFIPQAWSKNFIHIRALGNYLNNATDICVSQTGDPPATTEGLEPVNILSVTTEGDGNAVTNISTNNVGNLVVTKNGSYLPVSGGTLTGRVTTSKALNYLLTGTGTAGADKGSGQNPRYVPAKWTFDTGQTPTDGDIIIVKNPVAGHDYGVYISINNGTSYHPAVLKDTSRLTTHYGGAGNYSVFIFRSAGSAASMIPLAGNTDGTRVTVTGGVWTGIDYYDSGNTYDRTSMQTRIYAGGVGVFRYSICAMNSAQRMESFTTTGDANGSPTTTKTFNTSAKFAFPPVIMYNSANSVYSDGSAIGNNVLYEQYPSVDMRYSCNKTSSSGFTQYKPIFIECTFDDNGYFSITSNGFVQTFTSGKYYILVGCTYSTSVYQLALFAQHPLFYYDGTNLKYTPPPHTHPYLPLTGGTLTGRVTLGSSTSPITGFKQYTSNSESYVPLSIWSYGDTWGTWGAEIGFHNQYNGSTPDTKGAIVLLPYQTSTAPYNGTVGFYLEKDHGYIEGNEILVHKSVDSTTINNSAGSFTFSGSGEPWAGTDWVGLQVGDNKDKFQLTASGGKLMIRQNDNGGTSSSDWTAWKTLSDTTHTHAYVPLAGGTMDYSATISFPRTVNDDRYTKIGYGGIDLYGATTAGWAMGMRFNVGNTRYMDFGGYGGSNDFSYLYIGLYDAPVAKFTTDKKTEFAGDVTLRSSSGNSPSLVFQHGTTTDALLDWKMCAVNSDLKLYSTANTSPESWTNIMTLGGGGITVNKKIGGMWVTDYKGTSYPMVRDNGENLWFGAGSTTSYHHSGQTYLSAGWYNGDTLPTTASTTMYGNETIKVCVPRYSTNSSSVGSWNGANYNVIHDGPQLTLGRHLITTGNGVPTIYRGMSRIMRSNKLAFVPVANVTVEYSTNGTTYADMSVAASGVNTAITNAYKGALTTGKEEMSGNTSISIPVGPNNTSNVKTSSMSTRITIDVTDRDTIVDQFLIQFNSGYNNLEYKIEYTTTTTPSSEDDWEVWRQYLDPRVANSPTPLRSGTWAYQDVINVAPKRIGPNNTSSTNQSVKKIRFTFKYYTIGASPNNKYTSTIRDIAAYGGHAFFHKANVNSTMLNFDEIYNWDWEKNVTFPADVKANSLTSSSIVVPSGASYKATLSAQGLTGNREFVFTDVAGSVGIMNVLHNNENYDEDTPVQIPSAELYKYFIVTVKPNTVVGERTEIIRVSKETTTTTKYISFTGNIGPAPSQPTITLGGYLAHSYNTSTNTYTLSVGRAAYYIICNANITSESASDIHLRIVKVVGLA